MRTRPLILLSGVVALLLAAIAMLAWSRLPVGSRLPIHWNATGEANGFASAGIALFLPVGMVVTLSALFAALPWIEPMQDRMRESAPLLTAAWIGILLVMALIEVMIAAPALGLIVPAASVGIAVGLLFVVIGNALPKSRPGFFVGIRTPWTLSDRETWIATHRFGSRTMMAAGAVMILVSVVPMDAGVRAIAMLAAGLSAAFPPVIFSYLYWRRSGRRI
jgi:uncharacterized membrane protein